MPERCKEINKRSSGRNFTEELPALRAKIGITQEELCAIVGISRQTIVLSKQESVKCRGTLTFR